MKLRIALVTVAILLTGAALRSWDLASRRAELLSAGAHRAANVALLLSGYLDESFAARAGVTALGAVTVVDTSGIIRHSTQPRIVGQSRRDEYIFQRLISDTADALVAGRPFRTVVATSSRSAGA